MCAAIRRSYQVPGAKSLSVTVDWAGAILEDCRIHSFCNFGLYLTSKYKIGHPPSIHEESLMIANVEFMARREYLSGACGAKKQEEEYIYVLINLIYLKKKDVVVN